MVSVVVGEGNEFYDAKQQITFADLKNSVFNIVTNGHNNYNQIISNCQKAGYEPEIAYQSSQIVCFWTTRLNKGVCVFNRCMIYDNIMARPDLKTMRIIPLVPPPQCFCWVSLRNQSSIHQAIQIFADELTEALTEDVAVRVQ